MWDESKLKKISRERGAVRGQLTKLYSEFSQIDITSWEKNVILQKKLKLEDIKSNITKLDNEFMSLIVHSPEVDATYQLEFERTESYKEKMFEISVRIDEYLQTFNPTIREQPQQSAFKLKAPKAPLPRFLDKEGGISLHKFFLEFENIVNKFECSEYEKFVLLKENVEGRALKLVTYLSVRDQSYSRAKDILIKALANPLIQKFEVIERAIRLTAQKSKDAISFITEFKLIIDEFDSQKIDTNSILQYCILNGMDEQLKLSLVNITNSNFPTIQQIQDNIFLALERCNLHPTKTLSPKEPEPTFKHIKTESFAANIPENSVKPKEGLEKSTVKCSLCMRSNKSHDHAIFKCPNFPGPQEKGDFIRQNNGCLKCGYFSHDTEKCKFNFKYSCRFCPENHFSFLCQRKDILEPEKVTMNATSVSFPNISVLLSQTGSQTFLPTLTMQTVTGDFVRCLKDSGSEFTFFTLKFINTVPHKILHNLSPDIQGFNNLQTYTSKMVEVELVLFGEKIVLTGVVIPTIKTSLNISSLERVIEAFEKNGLTLADKLLNSKSSNIGNIDILLGSDYAFLLRDIAVEFGEEIKSYYLQTPGGVMLAGKVEDVLNNLNHLDKEISLRDTETNKSSPRDKLALKVHNYNVTIKSGKLDEETLKKATDEILEQEYAEIINVDTDRDNDNSILISKKVTNFILGNTKILDNGRIEMPLPWKLNVVHRLSDNFNLARTILNSNWRKLIRNPGQLQMTDEVIQEQLRTGIVERIEKFQQFKVENPHHSFLPHMSVFKMNRETTKCRIVFLSNICERSKNQNSITHNQALYAGPNLNKKLATSLIYLRFDSFVCVYDVKKAFLNIQLPLADQNRLLFLWYRDVKRNNFNLQVLRFKRLSFGLTCSPSCLMLALYKILILDEQTDNEYLKSFKRHLYHLFYMDNGGFSSNRVEEMKKFKEILPDIFRPYHFELQQYVSNCTEIETPRTSESESVTASDPVRLMGMYWYRDEDLLSNIDIRLDSNASTKRGILRSIAKNFDIFNILLPLRNRAKIFMQQLQLKTSVKWDEILDEESMKKWKLISKQFNKIPVVKVKRFLGKRGDSYRVIAYM